MMFLILIRWSILLMLLNFENSSCFNYNNVFFEITNNSQKGLIEHENQMVASYSLSEIIESPHDIIFKEDDVNVLSLIDSLSFYAIASESQVYFKALSSICQISDGYVSEYLLVILVRQYYYNLSKLLSYLPNDECIRKRLVLGLRVNITVGKEKSIDMIMEHANQSINYLEKEQVELLDVILSEVIQR